MKKFLIISALMFSTSAVASDDMVAECEAALEAEGRDPSGCTCLVEEIGDDAGLLDEFIELGDIEDPAARYEAASDAAKAAMDACTR